MPPTLEVSVRPSSSASRPSSKLPSPAPLSAASQQRAQRLMPPPRGRLAEKHVMQRAQLVSAYGKLPTSPNGLLRGPASAHTPAIALAIQRLANGLPPHNLKISNQLLGEGATASVFAARFGPAQGTPVAAKVVRKAALTPQQIGWIRDEIAIHRQLRHPHVCTLHGSFEDEANITMILSLCKGRSLCDTMGEALGTGKPLGEARCHLAFVQMVGALHYCHRTGVVHRDVKLDNLVWADAAESRLQLVDFGYAATRNEQSNFAGSPHYAAPEVHLANVGGGEFLAAAADVWSAGVCLFAMLATQLPFSGGEDTEEEEAALRAKVCAGAWDTQPECSPAALDLVSGLLTVEPSERLSLDEVCAHAWVGGLENVPWQALPAPAAAPRGPPTPGARPGRR